MKKKIKGLFEKSKDTKIAKSISIESPAAFKESIKELSKKGLTLHEFRSLNLAKTRSKLQLRRKNLSAKERKQFRSISKIRIPKPTR